MKVDKAALVFGSLVLWPAPLLAQLSIEGFTGPVYTHPVDVTIRQPDGATDLTFHDVEFRGEPFTPPLNYGVRVGATIAASPSLRLEIEFYHNKIYAKTREVVLVTGTLRARTMSERMPMENIVQHFSISHGANLLLVNLATTRRFRKFEGHARCGLGWSIPHTESTVNGVSQDQYETLFPAAQAVVGLSKKIVGPIWLVAEYKFTYASAAKVKIPNGHASTRVWSHHVVGGLGFKF